MRLVGKKYGHKEKKDENIEWWDLIFIFGENKITQRVLLEEYNPADWIDGASYRVDLITADDLDTTTIPKSYAKQTQEKLDKFATMPRLKEEPK